ncbi:hypothetical protein IIA15_08670, partial [candidate division TA06 bacterium]|nr:hypothetical protein [candidate division TA06 bacterium]
NTFSNPFNSTYDALVDGPLGTTSGRVAYRGFGIISPAAQGYSIRGYGAEAPLSLLLTSYR